MAISDHAAQQSGGLTVRHEMAGPWALVLVSGELDYATAVVLRDALQAEALPDGQIDVALELSGMTFCDSTGIGVFLGARKRLRPLGGRVIMLRPREFIVRRMQQIGLASLIPIYASLDDA